MPSSLAPFPRLLAPPFPFLVEFSPPYYFIVVVLHIAMYYINDMSFYIYENRLTGL